MGKVFTFFPLYPSHQQCKTSREAKVALLALMPLVERVSEIAARLQLGEEGCWELNAEKDELEKSLILSLGGFSVISRPLTDFEMTASSYLSFLLWTGRVY